MTRCCDRDRDSHLPAVPACHVQVDHLHPPPVDGILRIHRMEDGGLIHVDGEGRQSILIVYNGNNLLEETMGLVAHFLGGGAARCAWPCGGRGIFCQKARNGRILGRESLVGKNRTQVGGLLNET